MQRVSGVVLAGGQSRRLGRNKAIEPIGQEVLIQRVIHRLSQVASEIVVVVAEESRARQLPLPDGVKVAADLYPGCGSLGGIFTGLSAASYQHGIVVACDMPFLNTDLIQYLIHQSHSYDAVVPIVEGRPEPTHALYSKACVDPIEKRLKAHQLKIAGFFGDVRVRFVEEKEVAQRDPHFLSFFNINTQEDLDKALALEEEYS